MDECVSKPFPWRYVDGALFQADRHWPTIEFEEYEYVTVDVRDGELHVYGGIDHKVLSPADARKLRDWLNENVKD